MPRFKAAPLALPRQAMTQTWAIGALGLATAMLVLPGAGQAQTAVTTPPAATTPAETAQAAPAQAPAPKPTGAAAPAAAPDAKPAGMEASTAMADVMKADGTSVGTVTIMDTASGMMHVKMDLKGLTEGTMAIHIHETGTCDAPDFKSAGGHLAGGHDHGIMAANGPHQGDLPNLHIPASGVSMTEAFAPGVKVADVLDSDGGALVIHAKADDYTSQPSGDAGDRIACGVFSAAQ